MISGAEQYQYTEIGGQGLRIFEKWWFTVGVIEN